MTLPEFLEKHASDRRGDDSCADDMLAHLESLASAAAVETPQRNPLDRLAVRVEHLPHELVMGKLTVDLGDGHVLIVLNDRTAEKLVKLSDLAEGRVGVLLTGETGAGKEVYARTYHLRSRPNGPFIAVNCAAIPETVVESEMFGADRGAFTGLDKSRGGYFQAADGGTLFLDEIAELPMNVQAKLLRALEEREVTRLGSTKAEKVDVQIVAATTRDLLEEVEAGRFRRDLYYRIAQAVIEVPPLRDRPEEILPLAAHFLKGMETAGVALRISKGAAMALKRHEWPGNIRELKNVLLRSTATARAHAPALNEPKRVHYVAQEELALDSSAD